MSNLLKNENSPYLLQHAENPVHWYPWGEEAYRATFESEYLEKAAYFCKEAEQFQAATPL